MSSFKVYRIYKNNGSVTGKHEESRLDELSSGNVTIQAQYSSINYKDALAATGKGAILRTFPLIGGIDVAGQVAQSTDPNFKEGDHVLVTGCGIGENTDGGYSQYVRVPSQFVVKIPSTLSAQQSMILGTAGFTAGLCYHRMIQNGQASSMGPILINGASGGVGSFAIALLHAMNFETIAVTGKREAHTYLQQLGCKTIIHPNDLNLGQRPLESVRFAGAIDNVGGDMLAGLMRHIELWGNIACVGLAGGFEFQTTVMPMILRGVSLLGISSNNCPMDLRLKVWNTLSQNLSHSTLEHCLADTVALSEIDQHFSRLMDRELIGRLVVDLNR